MTIIDFPINGIIITALSKKIINTEGHLSETKSVCKRKIIKNKITDAVLIIKLFMLVELKKSFKNHEKTKDVITPKIHKSTIL